MKRKFLFTVLVMALSVAVISCEKPGKDDEGTKTVTISFTSDDITLDLGSTNVDLLAFATASDGSTITVSGIDYEKIGEQNATFKTGDVSVQKKVKVTCKKIAGLYKIALTNVAGDTILRQGTYDVEMATFNQLRVKGITEWFGAPEIIATYEDGEFSIPTITAPVPYMPGSGTIVGFSTRFSNIEFKKEGSKYALVKADILNFGELMYDAIFILKFERQ